MTPNENVARLLERGWHLKRIALAIGLKLSTISHTVHGRRRNSEIHEIIANCVGMDVGTLFGPPARRAQTGEELQKHAARNRA